MLIQIVRTRSTIAAMRPRKLGRTDEGIGYYLKSVALDPKYPQVRGYFGEAYVLQASTTSQSSNWQRLKSFAVRTTSIMRIWRALTKAYAL